MTPEAWLVSAVHKESNENSDFMIVGFSSEPGTRQ